MYFNDFFFRPALFPIIIFFWLNGDSALFPSTALASSCCKCIFLELLLMTPDEFSLDFPKEWEDASRSWIWSPLLELCLMFAMFSCSWGSIWSN